MVNNVSWADNVFVNKGNIVHERVCKEGASYSSNCITERSVRVYNDKLGIFGVLDCLEFKKSGTATYIPRLDGKYSVSIIEYKVTAPKKGIIRTDEHMQLLAQKICVDSIFSCDCDTYFYYGDTRRREKVTFSEQDYEFLLKTLGEIRKVKLEGSIPPIRDGQYCSGCSLKDICMPPRGGKVQK